MDDKTVEAQRRRGSKKGNETNKARAKLDLVANPATTDRVYAEDEADFLKAVEAYRQTSGKRFLNACDYLHIAKSIGFMRFQEPDFRTE